VSALSIPSEPNSFPSDFTELQGQYLAFIHTYTKLHRQAPSEQDMERYFRVTPPSVHRMVVELEKRGLIAKQPRKPRSITLLVPPERIPPLR
jgi:Mn-dependent DtxR family transcriptional regulator